MTDSVDWTRVRVFGQKVENATYISRPGSYAVIFDGNGRVAIIETSQGLFLPGGGAEPEESAEEALRREVAEECGREIRIGRRLGESVQFVFAEGEGHLEKRCVFYEATFGPQIAANPDPSHKLVWLDASVAAVQMTHPSQGWAIRRAGEHRLRLD